ncbi:7711_t:CDS:2 [Funneliformis mosseae]|uniref:7711_t:CDS:1 n=1 Tax=Funneliformis mosseae TaxID=27381 RepID=A0A9N8W8U3_FUNMO|nr:7711_t:CDS:2 [Funneliformis mosseae]
MPRWWEIKVSDFKVVINLNTFGVIRKGCPFLSNSHEISRVHSIVTRHWRNHPSYVSSFDKS